MKSPVIPFPGARADHNPEGDQVIRAAAQDVLSDIAAEPVPERLIVLATELARALDERAAEAAPTIPPTQPED